MRVTSNSFTFPPTEIWPISEQNLLQLANTTPYADSFGLLDLKVEIVSSRPRSASLVRPCVLALLRGCELMQKRFYFVPRVTDALTLHLTRSLRIGSMMQGSLSMLGRVGALKISSSRVRSCLEPGTWNPEPGTRHLEPGTWTSRSY